MKKISRRNFLLASGVVTVGAALAACGGGSSSSTAASSAAPASSAAASAPAAENVKAAVEIDFSNVKIEPLFEDAVDFDTFAKSDFRVRFQSLTDFFIGLEINTLQSFYDGVSQELVNGDFIKTNSVIQRRVLDFSTLVRVDF